jgi:hypothetical protein
MHEIPFARKEFCHTLHQNNSISSAAFIFVSLWQVDENFHRPTQADEIKLIFVHLVTTDNRVNIFVGLAKTAWIYLIFYKRRLLPRTDKSM